MGSVVNKVVPVILCGGSGTRLWPLSRAGFPKQFLVLSGDSGGGDNQSLFQQAISRIDLVASERIVLEDPLVVTNEDHRFLALDQLRELYPQPKLGSSNLEQSSKSSDASATLLLEPCGKNTAPALTIAALCAQESGDPILVVTPADQTIGNTAAFAKALKNSIEIAAQGAIAILGITPTEPATGYGYIKVNQALPDDQGYSVEQFVEKPDIDTAKRYLEQGCYFWNGGMFVLKASVWLAALQAYRPDILSATSAAWQSRGQDAVGSTKFIRPNRELFNEIPGESIDYAVMEKCASEEGNSPFVVKMVELDAGWNDLGAWDAVWQVGSKDLEGNVTAGDVLLSETKNSFVHASSRLVSTVGIENLVIVETADAVLVANRERSQDVKNIISQLEQQQREEKNLHRKVSRPWGWYDSVDEGERFKVKRIQVKPGASLSLQMHHHRAEHWIVVKGVAEITNGDQVLTLTENQSTYIPKGQTHRLANPGKEPLEIIEVQSGSYLGEDDIVRFEDTYGRS